MSLKDFNIQYMINGDGNEDDENEPSTSKSPLSSTSKQEDSMTEEKIVQSPKEKLVELDQQW